MNQERSPSKNQPFSHFEAKKIAKQKNQVRLTNLRQIEQTTEHSSNSHQSTPLHEPLWFWSRHSSWSYFYRGLFWGGIISFTSIFSGVLGVALTKIDIVEQAIAQRINPLAIDLQPANQTPLTSPMNVLLVEAKSSANEMVEFSHDSLTEIQTILLLKFKPESDLAEVINIPTDSVVDLPGQGQGMIKDAHSIGGTKLLSKSVSQLTDSQVDRYVRATPKVFRQLIASGKITLESCDSRIKDCLNRSDQVSRQQTALETIRQRLNIPSYLASFKTAITEAEPNLDTNMTVPEILSLANFIKELEPNNLKVDLLADYSPGTTLQSDNQNAKLSATEPRQSLTEVPSISTMGNDFWQDQPIAVQNTTENPELGRQVVAYLRHRNFRDVYLVRHIPLELEQTKIVVSDGQLETARYLKNVLGIGNLTRESMPKSPELILQLGEDATYLPTSYRSYN